MRRRGVETDEQKKKKNSPPPPPRLTLPFHTHSEDRSPAPARPAIARAGALLTAVREGLDGPSFDAVQAALADFSTSADAAAGRALMPGGQGGEEAAAAAAADPGSSPRSSSPASSSSQEDTALATQLAARWAALGAASAASALSPAGLAAGHTAAAGLGASVTRARTASATSLVGRKRLDSEAAIAAAAAAVAAAGAAGRVLAFLLNQPDPAARRALLADALEPAEAGAEPCGDEDTEFISTTPLRLVQAVDLELARLARAGGVAGGGSAGPALLPGSRGMALEDLEAVLLDLRRAALDAWDEDGAVVPPP